jgi:hypothetical protein
MSNLVPEEVKEAILADFKEWSGGFEPDECCPSEISSYIKHALPNKLDCDEEYDRQDVIDWLEEF